MKCTEVYEKYVKNKKAIIMNKYNNHEIDAKEVNDFNWKVLHSVRVAKICNSIAHGEKLSDSEIELATNAGLFHDIGRFDQIIEYHTEIDQESKDHGLIGYNILKEESLLASTELSDQEKDIIYFSTYNHNKYQIMPNMNYLTQYIAKIVRDADKIDILKGMIYGNICLENNNQVLDENAKNVFYDHEMLTYADAKSVNDYVLLVFSYAYDINTKGAIKEILEENLFSRLLKVLNNQKIFTDACNEVNKYLEEKLNLLEESDKYVR